MKIIVAIIIAFVGITNLYDALMIIFGTYLPPYDVLGLEASKPTYLAYKILSGLAMVIVATLTWRSHYEVNIEAEGRGQKAGE